MSSREADRITSAQQTLDSMSWPFFFSLSYIACVQTCTPLVLYEMSQLLNTQLDKETLATCVGMIESGVNPEALAVCSSLFPCKQGVPRLMITPQAVILELRRENATLSKQNASNTNRTR